jgi:hypothetical protein
MKLLLTILFLSSLAYGNGELNLPGAWQACTKKDDCVEIHYGCSKSVAVKKEFEKQATDKAYAIGGDPRAISCPVAVSAPSEVLCTNNKCEVFIYPSCKDKDCCKIITKFINPKTGERTPAGERFVWGPTEASCKQKCIDEIEKRKKFKLPKEASLYEMECFSGGHSVLKEDVQSAIIK